MVPVNWFPERWRVWSEVSEPRQEGRLIAEDSVVVEK
jgi:hypothetical protein